MAKIVEPARAKINLTLEILGRRPDGYHELESLVAFASAGDRLTLDVTQPPGVTVEGPFAGAIGGSNILDRTLALLAARAPELRLGAVHLWKALPVAAGLGGGSADAAALLRAVSRANPEHAARIDWEALAVALGADVLVCLEGETAWMSGIGERISPLPQPLPPLAAVIANPLVQVPSDKTARVFRALGAPPLPAYRQQRPGPHIADRSILVSLISERGNALTEAARSVVPVIDAVLSALAALPGAEVVALSGAGPSCFAVFETEAKASDAARELKRVHEDWWIVPATIG